MKSLAVLAVTSGHLSGQLGAATLDVFGIRDAVAGGLQIGAAVHVLGTASFSKEKDAFHLLQLPWLSQSFEEN